MALFEAARPGGCEMYALVKLVYSINFPIYSYGPNCSACYWVFFLHKRYQAGFGSIKAEDNEVGRR